MDQRTKSAIEAKVKRVELSIRDLIKVFEGMNATPEAATKAFQYLSAQINIAYQRSYTACQAPSRGFSLDIDVPLTTPTAYPAPLVAPPLVPSVAPEQESDQDSEIAELLAQEPSVLFGSPEPRQEQVVGTVTAPTVFPAPDDAAGEPVTATIPIEEIKVNKNAIKNTYPHMRPEGRLVGSKEVVLTTLPKEEIKSPVEPGEIPDKKHGGIRDAGFIDMDIDDD